MITFVTRTVKPFLCSLATIGLLASAAGQQFRSIPNFSCSAVRLKLRLRSRCPGDGLHLLGGEAR